jgi:ribosomal protein S18 acetylase RimI-like enzyme
MKSFLEMERPVGIVAMGQKMVVVRIINERDIDSFHSTLDAVAAESNFLRTNKAPPLDDVARFVRQNIATNNPQFVAVADDKIVGWCDIVRGTATQERHCGGLGMGVLADWRGHGLGKRLLADTIAAADEDNFLRIELSVYSNNHTAIQLYRNFGFVEEGRLVRARLSAAGATDIILMARLRPDADWDQHFSTTPSAGGNG